MSVQSIFQCFARTEFWNLGSFDFDSFTAAWVTACACSTLTDSKSTKANKRYCTTFFQGFFHCFDHGVQGTRRSSLGDVGIVCNVFYEFGFIHKMPLGKRKRRLDS